MEPTLWEKPKVQAPLDPNFAPAGLAFRAFARRLPESAAGVDLGIALERPSGSVSVFKYALNKAAPRAEQFFQTERLLKFLLWSRGGFRIHVACAPDLFSALQHHFRETPAGRFDAEVMGGKAYGRPFELVPCRELPQEKEDTAPLGRNFDGARIGFDLGASDQKVAAVLDGETVFTQEIPWDPVPQTDPQWHFDRIMGSLGSAAARLPRVDAIGGSAAGIYVDNRVRAASLFRGVPEELFKSRVKDLFLELQRAWGGVPFVVVNDGEVTALAGSIMLNANRVLGIAMGSSLAAGYVNAAGHIMSWLNELAFAPIDFNRSGATDEWSGDFGCGAQYLSQQCVGRLLPVAGIQLDPAMPLPEKLVAVQALAKQADPRALKLYETIGVYLGYAIAHYASFYEFDHCLLLGRVTSGAGGDVIVGGARHVFEVEFPELAARLSLHLPGEKEKRVGQAAAAASLPLIKRSKVESRQSTA